MSEIDKSPAAAIEMDKILSDDSIPKIYANGFFSALTNSDLAIVLKVGAKVNGVLSLSFNTAKTLAFQLAEIINAVESATGSKISTIPEVSRGLEKWNPQS